MSHVSEVEISLNKRCAAMGIDLKKINGQRFFSRRVSLCILVQSLLDFPDNRFLTSSFSPSMLRV